jgi:hypothetical protein
MSHSHRFQVDRAGIRPSVIHRMSTKIEAEKLRIL